MANLPEQSVFEPGVYQFETTDPVQGGPGGIDNRPTGQLTNRTRYLKDSKLALDGSQAMTGPLTSSIQTGSAAASSFEHKSTTGLAGARYINDQLKKLFVGVACSAAIHWARGFAAIGTETNDPLLFGSNAGERARLTPEGDLHIGGTSSTARLSVWKDNPQSGVLAAFYNNATASQNGALLQLSQRNVATWQFGVAPGVDAFSIYGYSGGTYPEYLRIDAGGRVGFGMTPTAKLAAQVNDASGDGLRIVNANNNGSLYLFQAGSTGYGVPGWPGSSVFEGYPAAGGNTVFSSYSGSSGFLWQTGASRTTRMTMDSGGRVGIGRLPDSPALLAVNGAIMVTRQDDPAVIGGLTIAPSDTLLYDNKRLANYGVDWKYFSDETAGPTLALSGYGGIRFFTGGLERMRIDRPSGRVGIGINNNGAYNALLAVNGQMWCGTPASSENSNIVATTAWVNNLYASRSLAGNGFQKLPSGLIIQWGSYMPGVVSNNQTLSFVFPIAFPSAVLQTIVGTTSASNVQSGNTEGLALVSQSLSGATIQSNWDSANFNSANGVRFLAIGY